MATSRLPVSADDRERWTEELCQLQDQLDALADTKKETRAAWAKSDATLKARARQLMRYMRGQEGEQRALPLTDAPPDAPTTPEAAAAAADAMRAASGFRWDCAAAGHVFTGGKCGHCGKPEGGGAQ